MRAEVSRGSSCHGGRCKWRHFGGSEFRFRSPMNRPRDAAMELVVGIGRRRSCRPRLTTTTMTATTGESVAWHRNRAQRQQHRASDDTPLARRHSSSARTRETNGNERYDNERRGLTRAKARNWIVVVKIYRSRKWKDNGENVRQLDISTYLSKGIAVASRFLLLPLRDMPVAVSRTVQQLGRPYRTARAAVPFDEQLPRLRLRLYTRRLRLCRLTRRSRAWPQAADLPRRLPTLSECISIVRSLINRTWPDRSTGSMLGSGVGRRDLSSKHTPVFTRVSCPRDPRKLAQLRSRVFVSHDVHAESIATSSRSWRN